MATASSSSCRWCGNVGAVFSSQRGRLSGTRRNMALARGFVQVPSPSRSLNSYSTLRPRLRPKGLERTLKTTSRSSRDPLLAGQAVAKVEYVQTGEEAKKLVDEQGYQIVDIRDEVQYKRAHIPSAVHIPYFILNKDNDISTTILRQLHFGFSGLFYGVAYTKQNPNFLTEVTKQFPSKDSKLLLLCNGGLRSGYASEKLDEEGYANLAYLSTGLQNVEPGIFPKVGKNELKDGAKGGLVTVQQTFSFVLGGLLILAYLFLQFFPDQAGELFFKT